MHLMHPSQKYSYLFHTMDVFKVREAREKTRPAWTSYILPTAITKEKTAGNSRQPTWKT